MGQGEYFIYATPSESQMIIFGSGTRIERTGQDNSLWVADKINIETITSSGFNADIDWQTNKDFVNNPLNISEFAITVLGKGATFNIAGDVVKQTSSNTWTSQTTLNRDWGKIESGTISYTVDDTETTITVGSDPVYIQTRLDLSLSNQRGQELVTTESSQQIVTLETYVGTTWTDIDITEGSLQSNYELDIIGGKDIDLSYLENLSINRYRTDKPTYTSVALTECKPSDSLPFTSSTFSNYTVFDNSFNKIATYNAAVNIHKYTSIWYINSVVDPSTSFSLVDKVANGYQLTLNSGSSVIASFPFSYKVEQLSQTGTPKKYIMPVYISESANLSSDSVVASLRESTTEYASFPSPQLVPSYGTHGTSTSYGGYTYTSSSNEVTTITFLTKTGTDSGGNDSPIKRATPNSIYRVWYNSDNETTPTDNTDSFLINIGPNSLSEDVTIDVSALQIPTGSDSKISSCIWIADVGYSWQLEEFNSSNPSTDLNIATTGLHLLTVNVGDLGETVYSPTNSTGVVSILANLDLILTCPPATNGNDTSPYSILVMNLKLINGINENLSSLVSLDDVLDRMKYIVEHSSASQTPIYYINVPDNDLVIENDDILNLFDKNNVASPITIAQLDFDGHDSYIEVVKSMMKG